ncbi:MAG: NAD(P)-binding protein [Planctomycetota bacterium]
MDQQRHAIVAGFGPVGRLTVDRLEAEGFRVTVAELNLETVERRLDLDRSVIFGCCTDEQVLTRAGVMEADALIIAIPEEHVALETCRVARRLRPDLFIAVRANYLSMGMLCRQAGADRVIVEEVVTAEAMRDAVAGALLPGLGENRRTA